MTRQRQSCEDMGAKCSRQNEQQMQGPKAAMTLVCSRKRKKACWMKRWEGGKDGTEGGWRQGGPSLVGCDMEQGECSGFGETLLRALSKGMLGSSFSLWLHTHDL